MKEKLITELKTQLMAYAINHDYFGFCSKCECKNGVYYSYVDEQKTKYSAKQLAEEWDGLDKQLKKEILEEVLDDFVKDYSKK